MNPKELFIAMLNKEISRIEILQELEQMTRQFSPAFVTLLIDDLADVLELWKYDMTVARLQAEYNKIMEHYEVQLNLANYALVMGTNEPIEWPEEPAPFMPPAPWEIDDLVAPPLFDFAMQVLAEHQAPKQSEQAGQAAPLAPTPTTKQEDAGEPLPPGHPLATPKAVAAFEAVAKLGYMERHGNKWQWLSTAALYGYFVGTLNVLIFGVESSTKWEKFEEAFVNSVELRPAATSANSNYRQKDGTIKKRGKRGSAFWQIEECLKLIFGN